MGKSLVIVESPAKAKTINKYLGNDYIVRSSVGHIRRLATDTEHKTKDKKENLIVLGNIDKFSTYIFSNEYIYIYKIKYMMV